MKQVSLIDGIAYGLTLWGLASLGFMTALAAFDPLGVSVPVVILLSAMFAAKTYAAYLSNKDNEKVWMVAVSFVPFAEAYYLYTRKSRLA